MKLTSKLLEEMIREAFEAPQESHWYMPKKKKEEKPDDDPEPTPDDEVKSEVRVPYKDMEAEKRALRVKSLGPDAYRKLRDMEKDDPEYADELARAMGSSEPNRPKIKLKNIFPSIIKEPVLGKGKYEGHFSLSPDKTKLRATVYIPDEDEPGMREFNGWRDFKLTKSGLERAKNWIASKMPPFPKFEDEDEWDDATLWDDEWDFPALNEEEVYVPPGEEEEDEWAQELRKLKAEDPEQFELYMSLADIGQKTHMKDFPEVDPEAKEKTFGTPSSTYGPVPWKWLASKPMFDDNMMWFPTRKNIRDDLMPFLQHMNALMQKYPKAPKKIARDRLMANDAEVNLDVKNLIIASNKENRQAWELISYIGDLIQSLRATAYGASRSKEEKRAALYTKLSNYLSDINLWINDHQQKWKHFEKAYEKNIGPIASDPKGEPIPGADFHLNEDELNRILDEEIAGVIGEADVYVPPGYEPEDEEDDFDAEMAEFFANDPDALAKLKGLMGGSKSGMALGDYPEVDPEAEEATFGVMSGEHSDVDWESIRRNMPFGGGRLRGDGDLSELENWIVTMLRLVVKYPIDRAEVYGDSERMDFEVRNLVVRGKEDQETAALVWDEVEDLKDYYIFPILEKFRISYKEPEDIELIEKLETYNKALHRISEWSAVQGDMYDEYLRSYKKKFAKPPAEPVGQRLPIREEEEGSCFDHLKKLHEQFAGATEYEDYVHALFLMEASFPTVQSECVGLFKSILYRASFAIDLARHRDLPSSDNRKTTGATQSQWNNLQVKIDDMLEPFLKPLKENEEEEPCETFKMLGEFFEDASGGGRPKEANLEAFRQGYELLEQLVIGDDGTYSPPEGCRDAADLVIFAASMHAYTIGFFVRGDENIDAWWELDKKFSNLWGDEENWPIWVQKAMYRGK